MKNLLKKILRLYDIKHIKYNIIDIAMMFAMMNICILFAFDDRLLFAFDVCAFDVRPL